MNPDEAIRQNKIKFWTHNIATEEMDINIKHQWYYQIQGQLHVTGKRGCLFAVWTGEQFPLKVAYVIKRDDFWKIKMEEKLVRFYLECILPELVDPRYTRKMSIREPLYIIEAQKRIETKKRIAPKRKL